MSLLAAPSLVFGFPWGRVKALVFCKSSSFVDPTKVSQKRLIIKSLLYFENVGDTLTLGSHNSPEVAIVEAKGCCKGYAAMALFVPSFSKKGVF